MYYEDLKERVTKLSDVPYAPKEESSKLDVPFDSLILKF